MLSIISHFTRTTAVVCHLYSPDTLRPEYERVGAHVVSLRLRGNYGFGDAVRQVVRLVDHERPDIIHSMLFRSDLVARVVAPIRRLPLVGSFVNETYSRNRWEHLALGGRAKLAWWLALDALSARAVTHFVAISQAAKESNARALKVPLERISVIHRGRDPGPFAPPPAHVVAAVRRSLGVENGSPLLLNVARLQHRKGQEELLAALAVVVRKHPQVRLLIAGEGAYRQRLAELIDTYGLSEHVRLLGLREDVPQLLHAADLFVLPSHFEGHSGSLLEAMFAGKPIIATDIGPTRESITHMESGCLVPVGDALALAEAILRQLEDPAAARRLGAEARRVALERFQTAVAAHRHEELYDRLVARSTEPAQHRREPQ